MIQILIFQLVIIIIQLKSKWGYRKVALFLFANPLSLNQSLNCHIYMRNCDKLGANVCYICDILLRYMTIICYFCI